MTGAELSTAVVTCVVILGAPGGLVAFALRLRGLWLTAAAPVLSMAMVGASAMVATWLGQPWSIPMLLAVTAVATVVAGILTRLIRTPPPPGPRRRRRWAPAIACATGIGLMLIRTVRVIPEPDWFAQSFDNVFHLSAAQFIVETGRASPWDISTLLAPGGESFFYPSGWHALVALVATTSGAPVTIASNACLIVLACAVWPVGAVLLARTVFGAHTTILISAGALSAGFAVYPFALIASMGTYPLVAAITLLPVCIAAGVASAGLGSPFSSRRSSGLFLLAGVFALGAVHPSALVMLIALSAPIALVAAMQLIRRHPARRRLIVLTFVLYAVAAFAALIVFRTEVVQPDAIRITPAQALGEVIFSAFGGREISFAVTILALIGLVLALRRRNVDDWVALGLWATYAVIYIATTAGDEFVRLVIGAPWYSDGARVAAFAPIVVIPLAARGAAWSWASFMRWIRRRGAGQRRLRAAVTATAVVVFAVAVIEGNGVRSVDAATRAVFTPTDNVFTSLVGVGPDERKVVQWIDDAVGENDVIANNPRDGSGFIYPMTGRHLLTPYMLTSLDEDRAAFYEGIADAAPTDPACEIADRLGVRWIVEFHPRDVVPGDDRFAGIRNLERSENLTPAYRAGESTVYKITGCGFDAHP